jgi:FkbH-like protein
MIATATADRSGFSEVREAQRAGRLLADYPRIGELLPTLSTAEVARVGGWLTGVEPKDVAAAHPAMALVRMAVTGNATVAPLVAQLAANAAMHQLVLDVQLSGFNQYRQDLLSADSSLYTFEPEISLCLVDHHTVIDELPTPWDVTDVAVALDRRLADLTAIASMFAEHGTGVLVLNTLPLTRALTHQLVDLRSRSQLGALWHRFNAQLLDLGNSHPHVVVLDLDALGTEVPMQADPRLSSYAAQHLSQSLLAEYAGEVVALARTTVGRAKKCLVMDLDNTLWGGVLAEDGPDGIVIGGDDEGRAFRQFQQVVKQIGSQGVLIAVSSKNDHSDVLSALRRNPSMVLREDDFVAIRANWQPKDDNVAEIARQLNLHPDSFVFMDDTAFECELVQRAHPGVAVVQAAGDPAAYASRLLAGGWFTVRTLTAEDKLRSRSYRATVERQTSLAGSDSLDGYLRDLDLHVELRRPSQHELGRLSQLTLRTNQFNLTSMRLDPAQISQWFQDPSSLLLTITSRDRFGDDGIVGAILAHHEDSSILVLDNFLLSCRVFSRGIESACLSALLTKAEASAITSVVGLYHRSSKNARFHDFYAQHGFTANGEHPPGTLRYRHGLSQLPPAPDHIQLDTTPEGLNNE